MERHDVDGVEADGLDIREVDLMIDSAAGHLNAQHGILVDTAIWMLDNVREWQGDGLWTPERYLAWRTGVSPAIASKIADIARRATEFPDCVDTLRRGEVSLDQIAPILRHAPGWADRQAAGLIPQCTVAQSTKIAKQYPWDSPHENPSAYPDTDTDTDADADAEGEGEGEAPVEGEAPAEDDDSPAIAAPSPVGSKDSCWSGYDDHGRFRLYLETDKETGEIIEAATIEARDSLFQNGQTNITDIDAVREIAERSLDQVESPARRNRFRTNIHLNTDGTATDGRGRHMPVSVADHITCDGILTPIFYENGFPISVGRTQHIVPDRTRRIVVRRDGGCRVPGCTSDRFVEVHHIVHWSNGGLTDTWNLICLCAHHHRVHHRGKLGIEGNADTAAGTEGGVVFTDRYGKALAESGARPKPPGAPPPPIIGTYEHPLGERLDFRWLYFDDDPNRPPPVTDRPN